MWVHYKAELLIVLFKPTCVRARWALMHLFMSICSMEKGIGGVHRAYSLLKPGCVSHFWGDKVTSWVQLTSWVAAMRSQVTFAMTESLFYQMDEHNP